MKFNIAICDDEITETEYLTSIIMDWSQKTGNKTVINSFPNAESFLFHYEEYKYYDFLLLDIEMGKMNGIDLARKIREHNKDLQIIFVTGFEKYIADGYDVAALHYLMKPVKPEKLCEVLNRAVNNIGKSFPTVFVNADGENIRLRLSDIFYIETAGHSLIINTVDSQITVNQSMSSFFENLGDGFVYTHRSYVVNIEHIKRISKAEIVLDNDITVPVSRRMFDEVNRAFADYYRR